LQFKLSFDMHVDIRWHAIFAIALFRFHLLGCRHRNRHANNIADACLFDLFLNIW